MSSPSCEEILFRTGTTTVGASPKLMCPSPAHPETSNDNQTFFQVTDNISTPTTTTGDTQHNDIVDHLLIRYPTVLRCKGPIGVNKSGKLLKSKERAQQQHSTARSSFNLNQLSSSGQGASMNLYPLDAGVASASTPNAQCTSTAQHLSLDRAYQRPNAPRTPYNARKDLLKLHANLENKEKIGSKPAGQLTTPKDDRVGQTPLRTLTVPPTPEQVSAEDTYAQGHFYYSTQGEASPFSAVPSFGSETSALPATFRDKENEYFGPRKCVESQTKQLDRVPLQPLAYLPSPAPTPSPIAINDLLYGFEPGPGDSEMGSNANALSNGDQQACSDLPGVATLSLTELTALLERGFRAAGQLGCRSLSSAWIKLVSPHKRALYPYRDGESSKPEWWCKDIPHVQPGHLAREDRVKLLVHMTLTFNHIVTWFRVDLLKTTFIKPYCLEHLDQCLILSQQWMALHGGDFETQHPYSSGKTQTATVELPSSLAND